MIAITNAGTSQTRTRRLSDSKPPREEQPANPTMRCQEACRTMLRDYSRKSWRRNQTVNSVLNRTAQHRGPVRHGEHGHNGQILHPQKDRRNDPKKRFFVGVSQPHVCTKDCPQQISVGNHPPTSQRRRPVRERVRVLFSEAFVAYSYDTSRGTRAANGLRNPATSELVFPQVTPQTNPLRTVCERLNERLRTLRSRRGQHSHNPVGALQVGCIPRRRRPI